jgi:RNA polymerase sigma factor (sigma-70 family)
MDVEDLVQVGRIALWKAYRAYDPTRGYPFEHYASRAIVRAVKAEVRREQRHWTNRVYQAASAGEEDSLDDATEHSRAPAGVHEESAAYWTVLGEHVHSRVQQLPSRLRRVFELRHAQGRSQKQVAEILEVTQQRVSQLEHELGRAICHEA